MTGTGVGGMRENFVLMEQFHTWIVLADLRMHVTN